MDSAHVLDLHIYVCMFCIKQNMFELKGSNTAETNFCNSVLYKYNGIYMSGLGIGQVEIRSG